MCEFKGHLRTFFKDLIEFDTSAMRRPRASLEGMGRSQNQIFGRPERGHVAFKGQVVGGLEGQGVVEVDGLEDGDDVVVPVSTTAQDFEGKVDLGVGVQDEQCQTLNRPSRSPVFQP